MKQVSLTEIYNLIKVEPNYDKSYIIKVLQKSGKSIIFVYTNELYKCDESEEQDLISINQLDLKADAKYINIGDNWFRELEIDGVHLIYESDKFENIQGAEHMLKSSIINDIPELMNNLKDLDINILNIVECCSSKDLLHLMLYL